jgi:hypothetical protein
VANEIEAKGAKATGAFLDETSTWTDSYFRPKAFKTRRREMFFADPQKSWAQNAAARMAPAAPRRPARAPAGVRAGRNSRAPHP